MDHRRKTTDDSGLRQRPGALRALVATLTHPRRTFEVCSESPLVIESRDHNAVWNGTGLMVSALALAMLAAFVYFRIDAWRQGTAPLASWSAFDALSVGLPLAAAWVGVWLAKQPIAPRVLETVTVDGEWLIVERGNGHRTRIPRISISEVDSLWGVFSAPYAVRIVYARGAVDIGPLRMNGPFRVDDTPDRFLQHLERALAAQAS